MIVTNTGHAAARGLFETAIARLSYPTTHAMPTGDGLTAGSTFSAEAAPGSGWSRFAANPVGTTGTTGSTAEKLRNIDWNRMGELHDRLGKLQGLSENLDGVYEAVDGLMRLRATNDPSEMLNQFGELFNTVKDLVPDVPGVSQFLDIYGTLVDKIVGSLDRTFKGLQERELSVGHDVTLPGLWPGGRPLHSYMAQLDGEPAEVPDQVASWVKDNREALTLLTGEDPGVERRYGSFLGREVDWAARDREDPQALEEWFFRNRDLIRRSVYGDAGI